MKESSDYLIKYFIEGTGEEKPPANWSETLQNVKENLSWDPENINSASFVDIASQVKISNGFSNPNKNYVQNCSDMMVHFSWRINKTFKETHHNYAAQTSHTDYGICCRIFPQLDFVNPRTKNLPTDQYTGSMLFLCIRN